MVEDDVGVVLSSGAVVPPMELELEPEADGLELEVDVDMKVTAGTIVLHRCPSVQQSALQCLTTPPVWF